MVSDRDYFWVVLSKNHRFQHKENTSYAHPIARGETGAYSPLPALTEKVTVRAATAASKTRTKRRRSCAM
jgi:hypothetical protein